MDDKGGRVIGGRYSLDREIGRGGMGSVWLGRDEVLGRRVAIKRVGAMPGGSSPDLVRAEREARIAARVNHPHVVAVFDLVHEGDEKWLVMEYVEGQTLAEQIRDQGPLGHSETAHLLAQAAEALSAAHAAGVIHRDVKPSNILVTAEGQAKLSDFGIARAEADASLTATGLVTGSPAYIAPEVASGRMASGASDVWSLGATAYHALTGRPPYDVGDNVLGALYRIVHEEPPRLENGGWLTPFVTAAMTRDPAQRWTMGEVSAFLRSEGSTAPRPVPVAAPDSQSTQVMSLSGHEAQAATTPVATPVAAPVARPTSRRGRRRLPVLPIVVGVSALVLAVMVGLLLLDDEADPRQEANDDPSTPSTSQSQTQQQQPDRGELRQEMEDFVSTYLTTADSDPEAAFAMLTPAYQAESNGLAGYEEFWGDVVNIDIAQLAADVDDLTVKYTYSYDLEGGGQQTDTVRMELTSDGRDGYLVADAETIA